MESLRAYDEATLLAEQVGSTSFKVESVQVSVLEARALSYRRCCAVLACIVCAHIPRAVLRLWAGLLQTQFH